MNLGRNILWNLVAFLWLSLLVIVVTPFMVHRMGLDAFGAWSVLIALVWTLITVDVGLGSALIRCLATEHERGDRAALQGYFRAGLALQTLIGFAGGALFFLISEPLLHHWLKVPPELQEEALASFRLSALAVVLGFPVATYAAVPAALRRFDLLAGRAFFFHTGYYVLAVLALRRGGGLIEVVAAYVLSTLLMLFYLAAISARLLPGVNLLPGWNRTAVVELLRFGLHKFPAQLSLSLLQQFDRFALAAFLPVGVVSFYAVPLRLSQRMREVVEQIASPFYPAVTSHLAAGRARDLEDQYRHGIRLVSALAGGTVAVAGGLAYPLLAVWMGRDFAELGTWPFRVLLLAYGANALALLPTVAADAAGRPAIPAVYLVAGSLGHIPLVLLLIPRFGLTGAAVGVLAGFLIPLIFGVRAIHRRIPQLPSLGSLFADVRGVMSATAITGAAAVLLAGTSWPDTGVMPLVASVVATGALYAGLLFLFRGVATEDLRRFAGLFRRSRP